MFSTDHLHPMLVHFPIALVVFGFLADIMALFFKKEHSLSMMGFYLLIAGTLSALVALNTGVFFTTEMSGSAGKIKETHELFAWITVGTLLASSVLRIILKKLGREGSNLKWVALGLYGIATLTVSITGFYGGTLVYNYMMPI